MAKKRILSGIRLDKIAAVGDPCQAPATVAIIKSRRPVDAPPAIVKKTFQEALRSELLEEKVCDAFWRAFENQWAVREAFKEALTDEIDEGGDGSAAASGFTEAMKQIASAAAQAARDAASTADVPLATAVEGAVTKWLSKQRKENPMKILTKAALVSSVASFVFAKATAPEMAAIVDAAVDLNATDTLAEQPELLAMATAKAASKQTAALALEVSVLKMAPEIRKHYDALPEAERAAFAAKSASDQAAEVAAASASDPVVFKSSAGIEVRKSHGDLALALARQNDEMAKALASLTEGNEQSAIEKRAKAYANVAENVAKSMIKSAITVGETSAEGVAILASLDTMNKAGSSLYVTLGTTENGNPTGDMAKARQTFDAAVKKAQADFNLGPADAMSKVRTEQPALFAEAYPTPTAA